MADAARARGWDATTAEIEFTDPRYASRFSKVPMHRPLLEIVGMLPAQLRRRTGEIRIPPEAETGDHDLVVFGSPTWCTATEAGLRAEMGGGISSLVMALTEDRSLASFAERKEALRDQVRAAGPRAISVFAADKLSDIRGLQRGIGTSRESIEARMGTTIAAMAGHYGESVLMIEASDPSSCFVPALRRELASLTTPAE